MTGPAPDKRFSNQPDTDSRCIAVIVGAGFIGLELAGELTERLRAVAAPVGGHG